MPRSTASPPKPRATIRRRRAGTKRPDGRKGRQAGPECANPNPKENAMLRTLATAAVLALSIGTAQAEPPPAITIPIGDLNLANPGDARILAGRAQAAAQTACADWKPDRWQSSSYQVN